MLHFCLFQNAFKWNHTICSVESLSFYLHNALRLIHVVIGIGNFFLFNAEFYSTYNLFIHSPMDGHLCFFSVVSGSNYSYYQHLCIGICVNIYHFSGGKKMPSWSIAGPYSEYIFNFIRASSSWLKSVIDYFWPRINADMEEIGYI